MPPAEIIAMEHDEIGRLHDSSRSRRSHNEHLDDAVLRHLQRHPPQSHQSQQNRHTRVLVRSDKPKSSIPIEQAPQAQQPQQTSLHQSQSSLSQPKPIRRTILPSRSQTKLMRQVSALGMEDPVFRTTEQGPPHHPSNIYDDMGITHLPVDMMDMVSVASDPTATLHEGFLDLTLFQQSLANSSLLESSTAAALHSLNSSLLYGGHVAAAAATPVSPEQPMIVSHTTNAACPMDIVTTTRPTRDQASQRGNGSIVMDITAPVLVPHNRSSRHNSTAIMTTHWNQSSPIKSETTRSQTSYASSYLQQQHRKEKGQQQCDQPQMGASLPSLDLDAVFAHQVATSTAPTTIPNHGHSAHHPTNNTDLLLAEAAQALEQQGHGSSSAACAALIQAAKRQQQPHQPQSHQQHQHHQYHRQYSAPATQSAAAAAAAAHHVSCSTLKHTSTTSVQSSRSSGSTNGTRKVSRRHSTGVVPIVSDVETSHTTSKHTSSSSSRSRCLPTLESLFPDAATATAAARTTALLPPMRTDSCDSNFSLLMLSGPPPSLRGGSRSARRSSAHGGLFGAAHAADTHTAAASKWLR
jgi:hypothetical protein